MKTTKKFIPFYNKIEIEPLKKEMFLEQDSLEEKGVVIQVNPAKNILMPKVGDILFFRAFGCDKTVEHDGRVHYVVEFSPEFIIGWESNGISKK